MKLITTTLLFLVALYFLSAQEPLDPAKMSEAALLAKARQLVQEEFELTRLAARKAGTSKVRQFAERAEERLQKLDAELTTRAATAGVTEPQKISESMQQRLSAIEKIQGAAFDPDYLDMLIDMQANNIAILDELAKRADDPQLRDLARDAVAAERAQRDAARKLVVREVPDAK
jgi:putative membrane protein